MRSSGTGEGGRELRGYILGVGLLREPSQHFAITPQIRLTQPVPEWIWVGTASHREQPGAPLGLRRDASAVIQRSDKFLFDGRCAYLRRNILAGVHVFQSRR